MVLLQIVTGNPTSEDHSAMSAEAFLFAKKGDTNNHDRFKKHMKARKRDKVLKLTQTGTGTGLAKAVRSMTGDTPLDEFPPVCPELARCYRVSVKLPDYEDVKLAVDAHSRNPKGKLEPIRFTIRNDIDDKKTMLFADFSPATRGFTVKTTCEEPEELLQVVLPNQQQTGGMGKLLHPVAGVSLFKMVKGPGDDKFLIQRTGGSHPGTFLEINSKPRLDLQAAKLSQLNFDDKEYRINTVGSDITRIAKIWPKLAPSSRTYVIELSPNNNYGYQTRVVVISVALILTLHVAYPELLNLIPNDPAHSASG